MFKHDPLADVNDDLEPKDDMEEEAPDYKEGLHAAAASLLSAIESKDPAAVAEALQSAVSLCHAEPDGDEEDQSMPPPGEKGKGLLILAGKPEKK